MRRYHGFISTKLWWWLEAYERQFSGILFPDGNFVFTLDDYLERRNILKTSDEQLVIAVQLDDSTDMSWMQVET